MEPTILDREESRRQIADAERALARLDVAAAIPLLESAWKHDPHNDELPLMAATLHLREGDAIRAAHRVVEALMLRPFNPTALDVLAVACSDALQPGLAQKILRRAIRMAPGLANAKRNLEEAKQRAKEIRQAAVPKQELLRAAHFLPLRAIARLLEDRDAEMDLNVVATRSGEIVEVQGCSEGHPISRESMDELVSLALKATPDLVAIQLECLRKAGIELNRLLVS